MHCATPIRCSVPRITPLWFLSLLTTGSPSIYLPTSSPGDQPPFLLTVKYARQESTAITQASAGHGGVPLAGAAVGGGRANEA